MSRVVALWGKNLAALLEKDSFTSFSCNARGAGSTADPLEPLDQSLAGGQRFPPAAGQQVALEPMAAAPQGFPVDVRPAWRQAAGAEAGLAEHQLLVANQGNHPAARARRRF